MLKFWYGCSSFCGDLHGLPEGRKEALPTKSGYLPVDPSPNSSLYYALYNATNPSTPPPDTPLLLVCMAVWTARPLWGTFSAGGDAG